MINLVLNKKEILFYSFNLLIIFPTMLFGRSFMGLEIFSLLLGEILVAFSLLFSIYIIYDFRNINKTFGIKIYISYAIVFLITISLILIKPSLILDSYNYRSSSYVWQMSLLFLSIKCFKGIKLSKTYLIILNFVLLGTYLLSVVFYPNFLINFFDRYSDKFDFLKASDILIVFVIVVFLNNRFLSKYVKYSFDYFLYLSSIFLPLFIYKSRGSALAAVIFIIFEILTLNKKFSGTFFRRITTFIFCIVLFNFSTVIVIDIDTETEEIFLNSEIVGELLENKNTKAQNIFSFYVIKEIEDLSSFKFLNNGRVFSTDGNINFRLQIWQDVIINSFDNFQYFFGHGFHSKIPAMNNLLYIGKDGSNENVHNYFVDIYARGGSLLLFAILYFYLNIFNFSKIKFYKKTIAVYLIPIFVVSFFDSSMSSPNFPLLFFYYYGHIFININYENKEKID